MALRKGTLTPGIESMFLINCWYIRTETYCYHCRFIIISIIFYISDRHVSIIQHLSFRFKGSYETVLSFLTQ